MVSNPAMCPAHDLKGRERGGYLVALALLDVPKADLLGPRSHVYKGHS